MSLLPWVMAGVTGLLTVVLGVALLLCIGMFAYSASSVDRSGMDWFKSRPPEPHRQVSIPQVLLAESIARARVRYAPLRRRLHTELAVATRMTSPNRIMAQKWPNGNQFPHHLEVVNLGMAAHTEMYPPPAEPAANAPPPPPPPYQPPAVAAVTPADQVAQWAKEAKEAEEKNYQQEALRICQVYFDRKKEPNYNGTKYIPVREKFNSALVAQLADAMLLPHRFSAVAEGRAVYISESALDIIHAISNQKTHPGDD